MPYIDPELPEPSEEQFTQESEPEDFETELKRIRKENVVVPNVYLNQKGSQWPFSRIFL